MFIGRHLRVVQARARRQLVARKVRTRTAITAAFPEKYSLVALEIISSMLTFECVCEPADCTAIATAYHLAPAIRENAAVELLRRGL